MEDRNNRFAIQGVYDVLFSDALFKESYYQYMVKQADKSETKARDFLKAANLNQTVDEELRKQGASITAEESKEYHTQLTKSKLGEAARVPDSREALNALNMTIEATSANKQRKPITKVKNDSIKAALNTYMKSIGNLTASEYDQRLNNIDQELSFILKTKLKQLEDAYYEADTQYKTAKNRARMLKTELPAHFLRDRDTAKFRIEIKNSLLQSAKPSQLQKIIREIDYQAEPTIIEPHEKTEQDFKQFIELPEYKDLFDTMTEVGLRQVKDTFLRGDFDTLESGEIVEKLKSVKKTRIQDVLVNKILQNDQVREHLSTLPHKKQVDFTIALEERLDRKLISSDMPALEIISLVETPIKSISKKQSANTALIQSGFLTNQLVHTRPASQFAKNKNIKTKEVKTKKVSIDPISGYKMRKFE